MSGVIDWDGYRSSYQRLSYRQQRGFYDTVAPLHPVQNHFSAELVSQFLTLCQPGSVYEIGGWDGHLASLMLVQHEGITSWANNEIARVPQVCTHPAYRYVLGAKWAWQAPIDADAFVASHVLEHLSAEHLGQLLLAIKCCWAYVDVPLEDVAQNWSGYIGSHVLQLSIGEFDRMWHERGWEIRATSRNGHSHVRFLAR